MACTKQITVSIENLLGYNRRNKIGHDNSVKQNTYLGYYKGNRYGHAFRQRAPQQYIDVDLIAGTGGTASFVVTPGMSYTLDTLPKGTKIVNSNDSYLLRYNETTIGEIVASAPYPYVFDDMVLSRGQTTIQIGSTPIALENGDELDVSFITDSTDYLRFSANTAGSTVALTKNGSPTSVTLEVGINGGRWKTYTMGEVITLTNIGDRVCFRNASDTTTGFSNYSSNYYKFVMTGSVAGSGDVNYLLNKNSTTTLSNYCYYSLFSGCTSLTTSPTLTATTLANYCYGHMFRGCTSLTTAPALTATTLANYCYSNMFRDCTGLTSAPTMSATTLATGCYSFMFGGCTGLTTPPTLSATTLAESCYSNMFNGCTALTTTPRLPATTLYSGCYANMFENCSNLTTVSTISARTLSSSCCQAMFRNCTSLTTAPTLSATTMAMGCYQEMFKGCTSLVTAPALPATTLDYNCYQGMFQDCTSLTTPSRLPATTAASWGYAYMYKGCTSLNKLPALPATTFGSYSYYQMFNGCHNIRISETQDGTYTNVYRIPTTGTGGETWYSLDNMFGNTGGTFTGSPLVNTTYYTSNAIVS